MPRLTIDVVQQLLDEMNRLVTDYPKGLQMTGRSVKDLIAGTAFFPGGSGLWRGNQSGGPLPEYFPEQPVMFVGHNFDSVDAYQRALLLKGLVDSTFWQNLKGFLERAGPLDPSDCFFSNALMGLKPDKPDGPMPDCEGYRPQCQRFLVMQFAIVKPKAVVTLGRDAAVQWRHALKLDNSLRRISHVGVMHPSARPKDQKPDREGWLAAQGSRIAQHAAVAGLHKGTQSLSPELLQ